MTDSFQPMHLLLGVNPRGLLGLLHVVVKWVIFCLCIWKSVGGKLVLVTTWGGGELFTLHESWCKLILCHYCKHRHTTHTYASLESSQKCFIWLISDRSKAMQNFAPAQHHHLNAFLPCVGGSCFKHSHSNTARPPWLSSFCRRGRQRSTVRRYWLESAPQQGFSANQSTLRRVNGRRWESSESEAIMFLLR